jgi:hypothetical protein
VCGRFHAAAVRRPKQRRHQRGRLLLLGQGEQASRSPIAEERAQTLPRAYAKPNSARDASLPRPLSFRSRRGSGERKWTQSMVPFQGHARRQPGLDGHGAHLSSTGSIPGGTPASLNRDARCVRSLLRSGRQPAASTHAALFMRRAFSSAGTRSRSSSSVAQAGRWCGAMSAASVHPFSPRTEVPASTPTGNWCRQLTEISASYVFPESLARRAGGRPARGDRARLRRLPRAPAGTDVARPGEERLVRPKDSAHHSARRGGVPVRIATSTLDR